MTTNQKDRNLYFLVKAARTPRPTPETKAASFTTTMFGVPMRCVQSHVAERLERDRDALWERVKELNVELDHSRREFGLLVQDHAKEPR